MKRPIVRASSPTTGPRRKHRSRSGDGHAPSHLGRGACVVSCPGHGGGWSRLGLSGHAAARAARHPGPEAGARQRAGLYPGADRRCVQPSGLVSRRASDDAANRGARRKACGAGLRAMSPAERRRSPGIVEPGGASGVVPHAPTGRLQERRSHGRACNHDDHDRPGDLGRRRARGQRVLRFPQTRHLD